MCHSNEHTCMSNDNLLVSPVPLCFVMKVGYDMPVYVQICIEISLFSLCFVMKVGYARPVVCFKVYIHICV